MNLTKTRIWGSPLVPSPPPEDGPGKEPKSEGASSPSREVDLRATRAAPIEHARVPAAELAQRISPRSGTRIMNLATLLPRAGAKDSGAAPDLHRAEPARGATRILPIEELTRAGRKEEPAPPEQGSEEQPKARPRALGEKNILRLVCVALAAVCVVLWVAAALVESSAPTPTSSDRAVALPSALPTVPKRASGHSQRPNAAGAATSAVNEEGSTQQHDPRARAAVDALVRGDDELARSLYEELAAHRPEQPAYAEAARILRMRHADPR